MLLYFKITTNFPFLILASILAIEFQVLNETVRPSKCCILPF